MKLHIWNHVVTQKVFLEVKIYLSLRFLKVATLCLDDSFAQFCHSLNQLHEVIMLAQLKTIVLIKEAKKLSFFRLVEYLEIQHLWVRLQAQNGQKQRPFF